MASWRVIIPPSWPPSWRAAPTGGRCQRRGPRDRVLAIIPIKARVVHHVVRLHGVQQAHARAVGSGATAEVDVVAGVIERGEHASDNDEGDDGADVA